MGRILPLGAHRRKATQRKLRVLNSAQHVETADVEKGVRSVIGEGTDLGQLAQRLASDVHPAVASRMPPRSPFDRRRGLGLRRYRTTLRTLTFTLSRPST